MKLEVPMKLYIARDKNGDLNLYKYFPPNKNEENTEWIGKIFFGIDDEDLFPEVKWEDEEPTEVELVIKK